LAGICILICWVTPAAVYWPWQLEWLGSLHGNSGRQEAAAGTGLTQAVKMLAIANYIVDSDSHFERDDDTRRSTLAAAVFT
jgi:hypothetical protein